MGGWRNQVYFILIVVAGVLIAKCLIIGIEKIHLIMNNETVEQHEKLMKENQ